VGSIVEIINTGSELMLGRTLNTHQRWLCRRLSDLGFRVTRQISVSDTGIDIQQAVRESLSRADLVITTGGLGPTSDDLTRDLVAQLLGRKLRENAEALANITRIYSTLKRTMPERVRVQALIPEGAIVLPNKNGTAPGLALEVAPKLFRNGDRSSWLIMLPGPPRELYPMFEESVVPLLGRVLPPRSEFICKTLRTVGVPESVVQEKIERPLGSLVQSGLEVGYCARVGQVDIRLSTRGKEAVLFVQNAENIVRETLGRAILGVEDEEIEEVLVRLLSRRKQTLAVAESCTGGFIANRITNVPGASAVLLAGLVTYSNEAKQIFLGVRTGTLTEHGAVSESVAREMAEGARTRAGSDYALSVTGIAGPGGGTQEKPVGTVFIGLTGPEGTVVDRNFNPFDRETFKEVTALQAMNRLRLLLEQGTSRLKE
jgi:competence/damage-inducible protein CinA-like protein